MSAIIIRGAIAAVVLMATTSLVIAHGDVAPQPVNTDTLPEVGEEWLTENPYRADKVGDETWWQAVVIGDSGYNQNCARCHGLEAISGGIAPDLRYLELGKTGDEWFIERIRHGKKNSEGTTIMPAFEGVFSQEAMWAIRSFLESKHEE